MAVCSFEPLTGDAGSPPCELHLSEVGDLIVREKSTARRSMRVLWTSGSAAIGVGPYALQPLAMPDVRAWALQPVAVAQIIRYVGDYQICWRGQRNSRNRRDANSHA